MTPINTAYVFNGLQSLGNAIGQPLVLAFTPNVKSVSPIVAHGQLSVTSMQ